MASPGNRHCANCVGSLSFPLRGPRNSRQSNRLDDLGVTGGGDVARHDHVSLDPEQRVCVGVETQGPYTVGTSHQDHAVSRAQVACPRRRQRRAAVRVQQSPAPHTRVTHFLRRATNTIRVAVLTCTQKRTLSQHRRQATCKNASQSIKNFKTLKTFKI